MEQEASISQNGEVGGNTNEDRVVESLNDSCKDYSNNCNGFGDIMSHGPTLKPMLHVDKMYAKSTETKIDLPVRASRSFDNNIFNLLQLFESLVPDVEEESDINAFNNTNLWNLNCTNIRKVRPWEFIKKVYDGTTAPQGCDPKTSIPKSYPTERKKWNEQVHNIFDNQFPPNRI